MLDHIVRMRRWYFRSYAKLDSLMRLKGWNHASQLDKLVQHKVRYDRLQERSTAGHKKIHWSRM